MLRTIIFAIVLFSALGFFVYSMKRFFAILKLSKPQNRFNNIGQRLKNTLEIAFLQTKLFRQKLAGFLHFCIYWGFLVLGIVVLEGIIEGFFPEFSFSFLGALYPVITVTTDLFGAIVFVVVIFSLIRRYIGTPKRLQVDTASRMDATFILILIFLVMITMFGANVERIMLGKDHGVRPVSDIIAGFLGGGGSDTLYQFFWWAHNIVILGFLNYLPYSKHFHVLSSVPNTFFSNFKIEPKGVLKPINFEDESIEQYGAKDVEDLTWKQVLDGYTCTECGRCTEVCPANITGKLLNPKLIITNIRKRAMDKGPLVLDKKEDDPLLEKPLVPDYITPQELWACTTCLACVNECPVMIDHVTSIVDMRRNLSLMESDFPDELNTVFRNLENNESPWAYSAEERNDWINELRDELESENKKSGLHKLSEVGSANELDVVFWTGCMGAFDKRYRKVTKSFAQILDDAGVKYGVLGNEEKCTGDPARRLGNEFIAQGLMTKNIETFKRYNVKKVVTACPHCMHTLKNEYSQFGIELDVTHHTEFIDNLIKQKKITPGNEIKDKITYHDSCYLGRYNDIYDQPRNSLESVPGLDIVEMPRNKDRGLCCGAGGGRMFMEETEGKRINIERTEEALKTGANTITAACPFCMTMLTDGVKTKEKSDEVDVKDIAEIVLDSIKK
ncbi:4Fe-4S dicluster domain-containing protein [Ignavibacteria bacterium CHB1]|jgi:Fe-S oxidoreductase|nr:MAG: 4Fe-4S dicluster domain-containing protein [Chlorobiota bacterium]KXK02614.1 MAG: Fe-S oxidoreductase [Chlorobi bacterium OLB4]MBV6398765.1 putative iron-sulfur-binding oxidoreductase FadF [Ignavibacteria bacterium]MCC6885063.1 4Fe-4S dicluster domain-containing protein [Ignavibacteriales bacterium]MCE7952146.1 4Fe-4S dicluster domain-containing protein [Chlorobi bacterium CHB7]MDL1886297.1 4Fe-4S dicluster domain-containing protein [Ignavibacteria bacterium CHB1]OQY78938.1 MAG: Fe-S 